MFEVNQQVKAKKDITSPADDYSPAGTYARKGELLVVRAFYRCAEYPIAVSHPDITNSSFSVKECEIEAL